MAEITVVMDDPVTADVVVPGTTQAIDVTVPGVYAADVTAALGPPGPPGPVGPAGLVRVDHGTDPSVARPESPIVLWVGSVDPVHADQAVDLIVRTG